MTIKSNGAEFKRFYMDPIAWPDGAWHEDEIIIVDGIDQTDVDTPYDEIPDGAKVTISGGRLFANIGEEIGSFESHFKKWRKSQMTTILIVETKNEIADAVRSAITVAGGRVM